ncbi:MAG: sortase B protein-sorting domain-containing protein [Oliverpabstia sp.]
MRIHKKTAISKKHCLRTMGILMASVMVLSTGSGQFVHADQDRKPTELTDEKKEELTVIYLDGESGDDENSGKTRDEAVKTFSKAAELVGEYGVIRICGTVTVKKEEIWELPSGVSVRRAKDFEDALVKVKGKLTLDNVRLYLDDIIGKGEVEGAVEREKVYVPKEMKVKEPCTLSEVPLYRCDGDGVFSWEDEDFVLTEYETECRVVFYPYDSDTVDYSEEKGWDKEKKTVTRTVSVRVLSLKPEEDEKKDELGKEPESTPEATPEVPPESTPQPTPESTPQPTPEETPESTPQPTPETTPESTPQPTPESAPEVTPGGTPEVTPGSTPQPTPETTPEVTPEGTPAQEPEITPGTPEGTENVPESTPENGVPEVPQDVLTPEEKQAAAEVQNLIDYLPMEVTSIEEVEAVVEAFVWYESLSEAQKSLFGADTYIKLTEAQTRAAVFNRQSNGLTIEGDFPWYVQFRVELKNEMNNAAVLEEKNVDTFIAPYDMKLWDLINDTEYKLNGLQVRITMPAPDQTLYTQLVVVHYLEDGTIEYITPVYNDNGTISFVTTSFSPYNLAGSKVLVGNTDKAYTNTPTSTSDKIGSTVSGSSSSGNKKPTVNKTSGKAPLKANNVFTRNPKTGDENPVVIYVILAAAALIVLIVIAVIVIKKRKNNS